jgi:hypothetical protein
MAGNELQFGLIGLGAALVLGLLIYNFLQERRARRHAQEVFRSTHRDVLLDEALPEEAIAPAPLGRMQPHVQASTPRSGQEPGVDWEMQAIDCAVPIDAPAGVSAPALFNAQQTMLAGVQKPLRWFGWDDAGNGWQLLTHTTAGSFTRVCATLQLADRRGVISDTELERFFDQLQRLCDQFLAVPRLPALAGVTQSAHDLDTFCADVDVQIAVNVIASESPITGSKLRSVAENAGLVLANDGSFVARDEAGRVLYALGNLEAAPFSNEQLRHLETSGVTLSIDVPRVAAPVAAFEAMIVFGEHLAEALGGKLVDDNRSLLSERAVSLIRAQANQFEQIMERQNIPAGSELARRLFS